MTVSFQPPKNIPLYEILPAEPLLLMGAGPVPIPHAVAQANGVVINHLGETMDRVIDRVKVMGQYAFQTASNKIMGIAGPSSAAMEMGITNLLWNGRSALILCNGTFSGRMGDMAEAVGADITILKAEEKTAISIEMIETALKKKKYDVVTMVQGETSCGVWNRALPEIMKLCKRYGALTIVDAVCTLSTMPLEMDNWQIDVVISGGQKGISTIPGVSLIAFSKEAWQTIEKRESKRVHWCLDALKSYQFWGNHEYHYTAPVPGILAMHEALRLICKETLEERFYRHYTSSMALQKGITAMGLQLFVPEQYRLNTVVAIDIPDGVSADKVRKIMADKFHVEISGAFGLNIIRIGQMGEQCRSHNLFKTLYAMGMSFQQAGFTLKVSEGMAAMEKRLAEDPNRLVT
jgi:alanine-glyoxylate transaminase / serine-glyoxylate transaminase / serine-pyruvate transaminase